MNNGRVTIGQVGQNVMKYWPALLIIVGLIGAGAEVRLRVQQNGETLKSIQRKLATSETDKQQWILLRSLVEDNVQHAGRLKEIEKHIEGIKVLRFGPAVIGIAGITHSGRCLVQGVQPDTGADRGGLRPGDMVTKLDDTEITSFEELVGVIAEKEVDQKVKVHVLRAGKASEHLVTLTRRPPSTRQIIQQVPSLPPGFIPRR